MGSFVGALVTRHDVGRSIKPTLPFRGATITGAMDDLRDRRLSAHGYRGFFCGLREYSYLMAQCIIYIEDFM